MAHDIDVGSPQIGYLSILQHAEFGYFGGYLVLDSRGRPLEFHCTAPVRPSRAQELLYGPTLRPHLMGELIGATLLAKAKLKPPIILTDQLDVLCLASQAGPTMACALTPGSTAEISGSARLRVLPSENSLSPTPTQRIEAGGNKFELSQAEGTSAAQVVDTLNRLSAAIDLVEPFGRIRDAIGEAQRITTDGPADFAQAG